jgi:hypothetical protein
VIRSGCVFVELENTPRFCVSFAHSRPADVACAAVRAAATVVVVAAPFVPLHVAPYAEGLAATREWALEGFLARVRVAVDPERAGPRESLVARLADVPVLALGVGAGCRGSDVMVVLPGVARRRS